jgi:hypothetical protein
MYYNISRKIKYRNCSSRYFLLLLFFFVLTTNTYAQRDTLRQKSYSFELQVFTNAGLYVSSLRNLKSDYNFKRTLFVYQQNIPLNFSFCLAGDTYVKDNKEPYNLTPYLKRAYLQYQIKNFSISGGLLVLEQFKYQRKIWQLRYIDKTFQNIFKYDENRSIGLLIKHELNNLFSYDIAIASGYNTPQINSFEKYHFMTGQTLNTNFCSIRLFNNISIKPYYEHVSSLFINKKLEKTNFGIEIANKISNNKQINDNMFGFSILGNHTFPKSIMCFVRYDLNNEYNYTQIQSIFWAGIQYSFNHFSTSIFYKSEDFNNNYYGFALFFHYLT